MIVVFGEKRHGKNEVAAAIAEKLGGKVVSFALALKLGAEALIGVPHDLPDSEKETKLFYGKTARHWWQWFGTAVGRDGVHKNVWIDRTVDYVRSSKSPDVVVVSDGRFYNERTNPAEQLEGYAKVMNVLVYRPGLPESDLHPSETEVRDMRKRALEGEALFDEIILNDGTLEQLREKVAHTTIMQIAT
jgi:hypothetical protein